MAWNVVYSAVGSWPPNYDLGPCALGPKRVCTTFEGLIENYRSVRVRHVGDVSFSTEADRDVDTLPKARAWVVLRGFAERHMDVLAPGFTVPFPECVRDVESAWWYHHAVKRGSA